MSNGANGNGPGGRPPGGGYRPDIPPRRVIDIPGLGRRPAAESEAPNRLTVSREVSLTGEISACDHLVVHGRLDGRVAGCQSLEVSGSGQFKGTARVDGAEISGRFEGELTVSGRLVIHDGGWVGGTVSYGQLMVEPGGRLAGTLVPLEGATVTQLPERGTELPPPRA